MYIFIILPYLIYKPLTYFSFERFILITAIIHFTLFYNCQGLDGGISMNNLMNGIFTHNVEYNVEFNNRFFSLQPAVVFLNINAALSTNRILLIEEVNQIKVNSTRKYNYITPYSRVKSSLPYFQIQFANLIDKRDQELSEIGECI